MKLLFNAIPRFRRRTAEIQKRQSLYRSFSSRIEIEAYQVNAFNTTWKYCLEEIPFYRSWAEEHNLPEKIEAIADLRAFPRLTKQDIVSRTDEIFQYGRITDAYSTGGTTGTPARYPRGARDSDQIYADVYLARDWWGLAPFDRYVHLWGHSHLFAGKKLPVIARHASDWLIGAKRLNAYDLSPSAIASYVTELVRHNPRFIVGYTSAIFKLARHLESAQIALALPRLRAIILTAETATEADVDLISRVFSSPVIIEYGAAEVGNMAVSKEKTWRMQVLWTSCVLRIDSNNDILVTTLNERLFPLINYDIGDRAIATDILNDNALELSRVLGRSMDTVRVLKNNGDILQLSAILPVHILKSSRAITAVQFRQDENALHIFITATKPLDLEHLHQAFSLELKKDHPTADCSSIVFHQIDFPILTRAGKQALFVDL